MADSTLLTSHTSNHQQQPHHNTIVPATTHHESRLRPENTSKTTEKHEKPHHSLHFKMVIYSYYGSSLNMYTPHSFYLTGLRKNTPLAEEQR